MTTKHRHSNRRRAAHAAMRAFLEQALARRGAAMPLARVDVDLRVIAHEAFLGARADHPGRAIVRGGAGDGVGAWDPDRLARMLGNLLAHALGDSSGATPVSFAWWGEDDEVVIEIEYDPERERGAREWALGLSIAREIARAHGGDLGVSDSASGRLFRVTLPRRAPAPAWPTDDAGRERRLDAEAGAPA